MNFPSSNAPSMPTITTASIGGSAENLAVMADAGALTSLNLTSAIRYYPFILTKQIRVVKLFVANGSTATGNIEIGIYDSSGTLIVATAATAVSGTNAIQVIDVTDTTLDPGRYYFGLANTLTTGFLRITGTAGIETVLSGVATESGSSLPTTATFSTTTNSSIPLIGLSTVTNI